MRGLRTGPPASTKFARLASRQGLTAEVIGRRVGVTKWAVYHWLAGRRAPTGPALRALSELLGRSLPATRALFYSEE